MVAAITAMLWATPGRADEEVPADAAAADEGPELNHKGQFEVNVQGGFGYRALFTYDDEFCGELDDDGGNATPCLGRSPFGIDLALGYAVFDRLEVFLQARLGLEKDFGAAVSSDDGPRAFALSPGIRGMIPVGGGTRFFATAQLWVDLAEYPQLDEADLGVRNSNGLQFDLHKTFGLYFFFGEIVSWKRWFRFEVDAGIGAQARFP